MTEQEQIKEAFEDLLKSLRKETSKENRQKSESSLSRDEIPDDSYQLNDLYIGRYKYMRRILFAVQGARRRTKRSIPEYVSIGSTEQQRGNVGKRQA